MDGLMLDANLALDGTVVEPGKSFPIAASYIMIIVSSLLTKLKKKCNMEHRVVCCC